ncbi:hypothetical protein DM02DRAFT_682780 [Periconia macrospinosa]|uniref:DUF6546 domain-containing protein n=1 Tax=Periconia macrospinosa TaxID=97972 RepID=A0A2V1E671_9PLEO|nr:hypothetical protein DM02DRAFT_682780 [Periconia macrospinosa]
MRWKSLPSEIRAMILEILINSHTKSAQYASVCKEWQDAIERHNFHSLNLKPQDVLTITNIMAKRDLCLMKYIWYSIELPPCNYAFSRDIGRIQRDPNEFVRGCEELFVEYKAESQAAQAIVEDGICAMLRFLNGRPHDGDMTLDINIYSPSDSERFKHIRYEPANTLDPGPMQVASHGDADIPAQALMKLFAPTVFHNCDSTGSTSNGVYKFWNTLPQASCVTHLLLRRQTRRQWQTHALRQLLAQFPNLKELCVEPWRESMEAAQPLFDKYNAATFFKPLKSSMPDQLKRLTIFEDFNESYMISRINAPPNPRHDRITSIPLMRGLAEASLVLQHLSAAFIVNACQFWKVCKANWVWEQLLTLTLTSQALWPDNHPKNINDAIVEAAQVAKNMPKLQTMQIWNGRKGYAAVYRYEKGCHWAKITWRATWDLTLNEAAIAEWQKVAKVIVINCENELLGPVPIRSHGEAVTVLGLENVACPVSIRQIHREHLEMAN